MDNVTFFLNDALSFPCWINNSEEILTFIVNIKIQFFRAYNLFVDTQGETSLLLETSRSISVMFQEIQNTQKC